MEFNTDHRRDLFVVDRLHLQCIGIVFMYFYRWLLHAWIYVVRSKIVTLIVSFNGEIRERRWR